MVERKRKILGSPLGNDVHVAGVLRFLRLAEANGYVTEFLGPAAGTEGIVQAALKYRPDILALSYRLTPELVNGLVREVTAALKKAGLGEITLIFGGTPAAAAAAKATGVFQQVFSGLEGIDEIVAYLQGREQEAVSRRYADQLLPRLEGKRPYPLLRHHFGLPSFAATLQGVREIAEAKAVDVISLGPDQNAQASFFRPEEMDPLQDGAGGVPLRRPQDLYDLYEASRCGNYPLLRIYSGTRDLLQWAELSVESIKNAWGAIPLCWYSELDGRSNRPLAVALEENLAAIAWYGERGLPVEVNEAHHWSLREAPDSIAVVMAYLAALFAKKQGVKHYVAQYMFNTPFGTWYNYDLAKMLAKKELITSLHDDNFQSYTQVRTGLASLDVNLNKAKGQLASSIHLALSLKPDIIHVVGYCEASHAATAEDVIESCEIVNGVLQNTIDGLPDLSEDPVIQARKEALLGEARILLAALDELSEHGVELGSDPQVLVKAIKAGILDAPHLRGSKVALGKVQTRLNDGFCVAVHPETGKPMSEAERLELLLGKKIAVCSSVA
ncbi:MAG: methionine synthase [Firmicutes bacterium]|mgnify:CR=1 FL=1|nr:methionine synthase [Bacillota bacterium]